MTPAVAKNALKFLERATLSGAELSAFLEVRQALVDITSPEPPVTTSPESEE